MEAAGSPSQRESRRNSGGDPQAVTEIELIFPETPPARFTLLWNDAPETCAAVVGALPDRAECFHAMYSGTVVAFLIDPEVTAPVENATICIMPGDLLFTHYDGDFRHGHHDPLSEIYWPYDRYARPTIPGYFVPLAANVFGSYAGSNEEWTAFAQSSRRVYREGTAELSIRARP